jgi:hypothetical protein
MDILLEHCAFLYEAKYSFYKKCHHKFTWKFSDMPVPNMKTFYKYVQKVSNNRFHFMQETNRCVSIIEMKCNKTAAFASI